MSDGSFGTRKKIVAIHQPNFFPWLGFFAKVAHSDVFVFLDDAQFPKKGGTWTNRTRLMIGGQPNWLSAPIVRKIHGLREVREVEFLENSKWRAKVLRTVQCNYGNHDYFDEVFAAIEPAIENPQRNVSAYNLEAIKLILNNLGMGSSNLEIASAINVGSSSSERLVDLTKRLGGKVYLSGDGSAGYLEEKVFEAANLDLRFQNFVHPVYPQKGNSRFVPDLSVLDCLFNLGWRDTRKLLEQIGATAESFDTS